MATRTMKATAVGSFSALAMAAAMNANAATFEAGDTEVTLEGYVKGDLIYDADDRLGWFANPDNIGTDNSDGHFRFNVGQSRFGFRTVTPTEQGDLELFVNMDFGADDGSSPRLREVYGQWNNILVGRTWSNFNTFVGTPFTLDFTNAIGQPGQDLQQQVRYTMGNVAVALEANDDTLAFPSGWAGLEPQDEQKAELPDLTVSYEDSFGAVNVGTGAMVRQLAFDDGNDDDSAVGYGVYAAANMEIAPGTTIRGAITGGDGIGNYNYFQPGAPARFIDGSVETIESIGGTVSVSQAIGIGEATVAYAYAYADVEEYNDAAAGDEDDPFLDDTWQSVYVNYAFQPVERVTYGAEVGYHKRTPERGGESEDAVRVMASAIYDF
ncbi:DcaP family trimeric outer membrane transporter [Aquisalimonas asiatica]|uniref:Porin n=1 Tax=Aquisalimonas asiatica TaxID=406100 RepID=A0A1H8Q8J1_9GAMM|nr:DcaP family trimeric outer membrane transporter [Aquisalimonas asiatica]SEO50549.1 hypothetical protein SAMN04488052_101423 [Aquisalimonas asiatica]